MAPFGFGTAKIGLFFISAKFSLIYLNFVSRMKSVKRYAKVIIPLKISGSITYSIPDNLLDKIKIGSRVTVTLVNKKYTAVVEEISDNPNYDPKRIKDIVEMDPQPTISPEHIIFWRQLSTYYLCTIGDVFKAACPKTLTLSEKQLHASEPKGEHRPIAPMSEPSMEQEDEFGGLNTNIEKPINPMRELTAEQEVAFKEIKTHFSNNKTTLLTGENGSGKMEIALHLIAECLNKGENALLLVPTINESKRVVKRLEKCFGESLIVYNSNQTIAKRKQAVATLSAQNSNQGRIAPKVILGLRSSLFLPISHLGLIVVTNEHNPFYKQEEPAPRFNARDAASMLAKIINTKFLITSPTPSFESITNVESGKYKKVIINKRVLSQNIETILTDLKKERFSKGNKIFSGIAIQSVNRAIESGEKILIFSGKYPFFTKEEIVAELTNRITIRDEKKNKISNAILLRESAEIEQEEIKRLSVIVIIKGEALLSTKSFRSDERGIQLFNSIKSLITNPSGKMIIQTFHPENQVFQALTGQSIDKMLQERKDFQYPPFSKAITISIRDKYTQRLLRTTNDVEKIIKNIHIDNVMGPTDNTPIDFKGTYCQMFQLMLPKSKETEKIKQRLKSEIDLLERDIIIDVDPI